MPLIRRCWFSKINVSDLQGYRSLRYPSAIGPYYYKEKLNMNISKDPQFDAVLEEQLNSIKKNCLLIVVATEIEHKYALHYLKPLPGKLKPFMLSIGKLLFHVGLFGQCKTVIVRSEMANSTQYAVSSTTLLAINTWSPALAVMVGICWGNRKIENMQMIDVLAADNIISFDHARLENGETDYRLDAQKISAQIVNALKIDKDTLKWNHDRGDANTPNIRIGPLLSGQKLIDDATVRDELLKQTKVKLNLTAIGGEMEGYAFANTCLANDTAYFVIKSVCDWAESKEKGWQAFSANAAFNYCQKLFLNEKNVLAFGLSTIKKADQENTFDGLSHVMTPQNFSATFYNLTLTLSSTRLYRDLNSYNYRAFTSMLYELIDNEYKHGKARSVEVIFQKGCLVIRSDGEPFNQISLQQNDEKRGGTLALNKWHELGQNDVLIQNAYPVYSVESRKNTYSFYVENLVPEYPVINIDSAAPQKARMAIRKLVDSDVSIIEVNFGGEEKISKARQVLKRAMVQRMEGGMITVTSDVYLSEMLIKIFGQDDCFEFKILPAEVEDGSE